MGVKAKKTGKEKPLLHLHTNTHISNIYSYEIDNKKLQE